MVASVYQNWPEIFTCREMKLEWKKGEEVAEKNEEYDRLSDISNHEMVG